MEKLPEFNAVEDIEEWIEVFEYRVACSAVKDDKTKIQWCRSAIGNVGRKILNGLPEGDQWRNAKEKLREYLGEDNPKTTAWNKLRSYKAKGKCFGEVASEIRELAVKAADERDVQERLAVEAFLRAIPGHFAREIRVKRIESLKEVLEEAKLQKILEEEEKEGKKRIQAIIKEPRPARQEEGHKIKENRRNRKGPVCWGCREGHMLRNCELWKHFKKGRRPMKEMGDKRELNLNGDH